MPRNTNHKEFDLTNGISLGTRIRELRCHLEKSQKEFAAFTGIVDSASLSDYEKDKNSPSFSTLLKIALSCEISLDYFADNLPPYIYFKIQENLPFIKCLTEIPEPTQTYMKEALLRIRDFSKLHEGLSALDKMRESFTARNTKAERPSATYMKLFKEDALEELKERLAELKKSENRLDNENTAA